MRIAKVGWAVLFAGLSGCSGAPGGVQGISASATNASDAPVDPHVGIFVKTKYFYPNITFDEITLLPGGVAYNRVPRSPVPLAEIDCDRDKDADDKSAACGTWSADSDKVTVTFPKASHVCNLTANALSCGTNESYDRVSVDDSIVLDGLYERSLTFNSTGYGTTSSASVSRSIRLDAKTSRFESSRFFGSVIANDGTVSGKTDGNSSVTANGEAAGTYARSTDRIDFTFDDGTKTRVRFFALVSPSSGELLWIYIGGFGYLDPG